MRYGLTVWDLIGLAIRARSWRALVRALEVLVGGRRLTPRPGERLPYEWVTAPPPGDTGGGYRPTHRRQDPSADPAEPGGGESSSRGTDHGWSNCTMAAGADVLAYHTGGAWKGWGGDLRHRQGDLEGGTDLYDLRDAWAALGHTFTIRSGQGWSKVKADHDAGRAIVIQGTGNVPGSATFDGGHACAIGVETHSDGRWLWGDPLVSDWQWVEPSAIRSWAERWQSSVAFGVSKDVVSEPVPPEPVPTPQEPLPCYPVGYTLAQAQAMTATALVGAPDGRGGAWAEWIKAGPPAESDAWGQGTWSSGVSRARLLLFRDPCHPTPDTPAAWARATEPYPVAEAAWSLDRVGAWDAPAWRGAGWP